MEDLLDSGAFHCKQIWKEGSDRAQAERLQMEDALIGLESGLKLAEWRIEADFSARQGDLTQKS